LGEKKGVIRDFRREKKAKKRIIYTENPWEKNREGNTRDVRNAPRAEMNALQGQRGWRKKYKEGSVEELINRFQLSWVQERNLKEGGGEVSRK